MSSSAAPARTIVVATACPASNITVADGARATIEPSLESASRARVTLPLVIPGI